MKSAINLLRSGVLLGVLLSLSHTALATPQQLLSDLQHMRLAATNAVTNFYMFSGLDADSKYERRIDAAMGRFSAALNSARALAGVNRLGDEIAAIEVQWNTIGKLMATNRKDMLTQGFPNVRLVDEMGRTSADLVNQISAAYQTLEESSGIRPSPVVEKARDLALLMEEITSQYAARGTTNLGQVFMGSYERTLTDMAEDFHKQLQALEGMVRSEQNDILMNSVNSKWRFMEERIRNYNENTVPFLVVSYNDRIVEHLEELESRF
ncbi:MAG: hypothetical protein CMH98_19345 [Oceanospirillaceae bacterium]|nr:hypothetical protein [Oceanospirillaceae bacterium]|tara:strand:+ start:6666 stop:7463 length:798 start_codon:yes stop_codon:yes gene_type:complete